MKKLLVFLCAVLFVFGVLGMAKADDDKLLPKTKKPTKLIPPHPVTMEEWTEIVRSLQNEKKRPVKPFQFQVKQENRIVL